jgi:hypothetical protein
MREIRNLEGESFLRIGKMQSDTIGVELNDFPGVLFICKVPNCTDPKSILEQTLGKLFVNIELDDVLSFGPNTKNKEKSSRWFRIVRVTRGFVGSDDQVAIGRGEKIILERNGSMLVICAENPNLSEVDSFLR